MTPRLRHRQTDLLRRLVVAGDSGLRLCGNNDFHAMVYLHRLGLAEFIRGVDRGARITAAGKARHEGTA